MRRLSRTPTLLLLLLLILLVLFVPAVPPRRAVAAAADSSSSSLLPWRCNHHQHGRGGACSSIISTRSRRSTAEAVHTAVTSPPCRVLGGAGAGRWARNGAGALASALAFSKPSCCCVASRAGRRGSSGRPPRGDGGFLAHSPCGCSRVFDRPRGSRGFGSITYVPRTGRRTRTSRRCAEEETQQDTTTTMMNVNNHDDPAASFSLPSRLLRRPSTSRNRPLLAIVTEPDSCITEARLQHSLLALQQALSQVKRSGLDESSDTLKEDQVDMVIIRLDSADNVDDATDSAGPNADQDGYRRRVEQFVRTLLQWSTGETIRGDDSHTFPSKFLVLLSSGLLVGAGPLVEDLSLVAMAHGVHIKESHRSLLPELVQRLKHHHHNSSTNASESERAHVVVGMSCHSVESAVDAMQLFEYRPDYLLVGTCYPTLSHPEKSSHELEGPDLPGIVRRELERRIHASDEDGLNDLLRQAAPHLPWPHPTQLTRRRRYHPVVLGIGGIDSTNCGRVIDGGADGVAVIRSVLANPDPASAVRRIHDEMLRCRSGD